MQICRDHGHAFAEILGVLTGCRPLAGGDRVRYISYEAVEVDAVLVEAVVAKCFNCN